MIFKQKIHDESIGGSKESKKDAMKRAIVAVVGVALPAFLAAANFGDGLPAAGGPECAVVISVDASDDTRFSVCDLKAHLEKATGREVAMCDGTPSPAVSHAARRKYSVTPFVPDGIMPRPAWKKSCPSSVKWRRGGSRKAARGPPSSHARKASML